jgi:hypothetical protein
MCCGPSMGDLYGRAAGGATGVGDWRPPVASVACAQSRLPPVASRRARFDPHQLVLPSREDSNPAIAAARILHPPPPYRRHHRRVLLRQAQAGSKLGQQS